jgi:porphobilinogen synthase
MTQALPIVDLPASRPTEPEQTTHAHDSALGPAVRLRRLRRRAAIRRVFAECDVEPRHLVQPYFIVPGRGIASETSSGSGLWRVSVDRLAEEARRLADGGFGGIMLFNVPDKKYGNAARLAEQLRPLLDALESVSQLPELVSYADVCLCSHLDHGHCGLVHGHEIDNDATLPVLARMATLLGEAGADFVAPSDMMDGRVAAIRRALDAAGLAAIGIVSYAVKIASAFYGPFRDAAESAPAFGDRASYQMPAGNRREARREWQTDATEGADALLFKPALTNLDLIRDAREASDLPLFAYQVSGEYAMLRAAANAGLLDFDRAMAESLLSIRRAGADVIVTYHARTLALV